MIVNRYIARTLFKFAIMIMGIVIALYVIIDYLSLTGKFINHGMTLVEGFGFVLLKTPYIFSMIMPVGCILAPIIALGLMKRNNEMIALQSGGISIYSLIKPIVACGIFIGLFHFIIGDTLVPSTITKAYEIKRKIRNRNVKTTKDNNIWLKDGQRILFIEYFNATNKTLSNISIFEFNKSFDLTRRIDAKLAQFNEETWILKHVLELIRNNDTQGFDSNIIAERKEDLGIVPSDLKRVIKTSEEMTLKELYRYVKKVESEGYDAGNYKSDMYAKTSWPFTCLLMALMGAAIVLARQKKDAIATNFAMGIVIAFLFWFFNSFCLSLGYAGLIPSVFSAWLANLLLLSICSIVLLNAE